MAHAGVLKKGRPQSYLKHVRRFHRLGCYQACFWAPASRHGSCCTHNTSTVERWDQNGWKVSRYFI